MQSLDLENTSHIKLRAKTGKIFPKRSGKYRESIKYHTFTGPHAAFTDLS